MISVNQPDKRVVLTGNEAMARGALEAGIDFCTSYPGSPCVEVAAALFNVAHKMGHYGEWSTNEIVAIEAAAAASFAGLRSLCVMKHNGIAVTADFLVSLNHAGARGGLVIIVGDDPGAHSSINEVDSRHFARLAKVPLLEPSTIEEARDMVCWAFELSEQVETYVIVRATTRICHARGNLNLRELPEKPERTVRIESWDRFLCVAPAHGMVHNKMEQSRKIFESSVFNNYSGPKGASTVIVCSGPAALYSREALEILGLEDKVGLFKIGTTWPLPREKLLEELDCVEEIIFVEEIDPFIEQNLTSLIAQFGKKQLRFYGQMSGHISGEAGPGLGELNTDLVARSFAKIFKLPDPVREPESDNLREILKGGMPDRDMAMCAGCPHRASFWAIKTALEIDGRQGFTLGDIGCYTLGASRAGFWLLRSIFCMGSGIGLANGFGQLHRWGLEQPVLAVMGDSTFFHACIPALINGRYNNADFVAVVLDNSITAMTGFQPHPGIGITATGLTGHKLQIEKITEALGIKTVVGDPHQLNETTEKLCALLQEKGPRVMILRKECVLLVKKQDRRLFQVDTEKCVGDACGCSNFCSSVFGCPAITVDQDNKAVIDDVICNGCGVCKEWCPQGAIYEVDATEVKKNVTV